jgi:hypothetical protein
VIHYYKEPHPYYNHDVLVVGAKNSAAIAALELHWTGARVTLIASRRGISDRVKYWIKPNIENRIKSGEIPAYFNRADRDHPKSVEIRTPRRPQNARERFCFCDDRLSAGSEFLAIARHSPGSGIAEAAHQSGNAGERSSGHFPGGRHRGRDAHQRNFHRERPLPRQEDRRSHRRFTFSSQLISSAS